VSRNGIANRHIHETEPQATMTTTNQSNTVKLHRVLKAPAERIFKAFINREAMAKWLPPNGYTGKVYEIDAKVGGSYRMSFTTFSTGKETFFGGTYLEIVPNEKIVYTDRFEDPGLPGEMKTTVSLRAVCCGTELHVTQEGIPAVIPAEACYLGWQESLIQLGKLVEAEIPDEG
jgi:uncharacterized protein YndB with AHSA1/START domain